ncbi:MAG TPA: DMT family transporter [Lichenihabitans sp.]|jgi:drug/metabolite transporter (DMT)-like permease|nr:DMT family transporter [Lichenihabitans sp.]
MAVVFGLAAALLWGGTDFLIRIIGRGMGVHKAMLYAQGVGALGLGLWLALDPAVREPLRHPSPLALLAGIGAAPIGLLATVSLYRGLQVGRVGLVSPITGAYGAVTAVLSLVSGETIGMVAILGLALVMAGSVLVCLPPRATEAGHDPHSVGDRAGLAYAIVACVGFGVQFWIQGRFATPGLGAVVPVWLYYAISTVLLAAAALVLRPSLALSRPDAGAVLGTGAIAVFGYLAVSAGLATGQVAIVTVLSSLQSAITVGLACLFLGERLAVHQWLGVAIVAGGLALIRAG